MGDVSLFCWLKQGWLLVRCGDDHRGDRGTACLWTGALDEGIVRAFRFSPQAGKYTMYDLQFDGVSNDKARLLWTTDSISIQAKPNLVDSFRLVVDLYSGIGGMTA